MNYRIERLRYQLREDPSSRVFLRLAELLQADGEGAEAVGVLRAGLEHHPRSAAAWVALGRGLRKQADDAGAAEALARAHALDPAQPLAARAVAEAAAATGDWPAAAAALARVRETAEREPGLDALIAEVDGRLAELEAAAAAERARLAEEQARREAEEEARRAAEAARRAEEEARQAEEEARRAEQEAAEVAARRALLEWRLRPPAEVLRISDGDPFGELTAAGVAAGESAGDVFAVREEATQVEEPPPVEEPLRVEEVPPIEELPPSIVDETVVESLREAAPAPAEAAPESWADVATEVAAVPELALAEPVEPTEPVAPSPQITAGELAELFEGAEGVAPQAETLDEIFERTPPPGLEEDAAALVARVEVTPLPEAPIEDLEAPAPESWADLAAEFGAEPELEPAVVVEETAAIAVAMPAEPAAPVALPAAPSHGPAPGLEHTREAGEGPLPTLTLARLAAHQGAWGLAVTTLERLLEREPGNLEAAAYLAELQGAASPGGAAGPGSAPAKVAALRAWLDTIRLGSERRGA